VRTVTSFQYPKKKSRPFPGGFVALLLEMGCYALDKGSTKSKARLSASLKM